MVNDLQTRDLPEQLVDEAEMVASELLTNAVRHARPLSDGTIRVRWKIRGDVVEVEVTDGGGESIPRPAPRTVWLSSGPPLSRSSTTPSAVRISTVSISLRLVAVAADRRMVRPGRPRHVATCSARPSRVRTTSAYSAPLEAS